MSKAFGANLKAYRQLAHMTQTDLAEAARLTRGAINNYERGQSEPTFEALCRISDVLGVDILTLITPQEHYPDYTVLMQLTDNESALLQVYRAADATYQVVAYDILKAHPAKGES